MDGHTGLRNQWSGSAWRIALWAALAALLLLPLVAMQLTDQVAWDGQDFLFAGVLLAALGLGIELVLRSRFGTALKMAAGLAVLAVFLLIWAQAAVGIV